MLLGVKYCGGCNPSYERVALVRTLSLRLKGRARLVCCEDRRARHLLVVAGCESACVDLAPFAGRVVHRIFRESDLERLVTELTAIAKGTD